MKARTDPNATGGLQAYEIARVDVATTTHDPTPMSDARDDCSRSNDHSSHYELFVLIGC